MQLPGLQFGSGYALCTPQTTSGNPAPNPTPLAIGVLQNVKLTLGAEIKTLFGQSQWAVDSAVGKRTIKGSFEFAQISNELMSQLFLGDGTTQGVEQTTAFPGELQQIPSGATPSVQVTNHASFTADFGVTFQANGAPLKKVPGVAASGTATVGAVSDGDFVTINATEYKFMTTPVSGGGIIGLSLAIELDKRGLRIVIIDKSEPGRSGNSIVLTTSSADIAVSGAGHLASGATGITAAGQYFVDASSGTYYFFSTDGLKQVLINYTWATSTLGSTLTVQSHSMGYGPIIGLNLVLPYEGGGIGFYVPNVRLGKIDGATKLDDYAMYTADFEGFAGANGVPFVSYQAY